MFTHMSTHTSTGGAGEEEEGGGVLINNSELKLLPLHRMFWVCCFSPNKDFIPTQYRGS